METIAVYKEEQIKVYTIIRKPETGLAFVTFPATELKELGLFLSDLKTQIPRFEFVTFQEQTDEVISLHIIVEQDSIAKVEEIFASILPLERSSQHLLKIISPVDIIYMHGPHFQDRYGIIDYTTKALSEKNIEQLVTGCAGTSIYIVTPSSHGEKAKELLDTTFLIPKTV